MSLTILHSIIFDQLQPWKLDASRQKMMVENIRKSGLAQPSSIGELTSQLKALLAGSPSLVSSLNSQPLLNSSLKELYYFTEMPEAFDTNSKYYVLIISKEAERLFNVFLNNAANWTNEIDIQYHTGNLLKSIKALTLQTFEEIEARAHVEKQNSGNDLTDFVLQYLKHTLIVLYLSIQEISKSHLAQTFTPEEYHMLELGQQTATFQEVHALIPETDFSESKASKQSRFSFGFKGDLKKLTMVINDLVNEIELVNRDFSSPEDLLQILTAKDLHSLTKPVHLGCETTTFRYVLLKLKFHFHNLTFSTVGNSKLFKSNNDNVITGQNLFSSKITYYKKADRIDEIMAQL